jgi:hypothetical protein
MIADKKLARALKQLAKSGGKGGDTSQALQALNELTTGTSDPALKSALSRISHALQAPPDQRAQLSPQDAVALLQSLQDNSLTNSAAVAFVALVPALKNLELESTLPLTPTSKCLAAWAKAARLPRKALEAKILASPELAWQTPALDWLIEKASSQAGPFISKLLSRTPRPKYLPQWDRVLAAPIEGPHGGQFLEAILAEPARDPRHLETLAGLLLSNPALLRRAADLFPELLEAPCAGQALSFANTFLDYAAVVPPHQRPLVSAALARLATGILLKKERTPNQLEALASISETTSSLKTTITDDELKRQTWILEPLETTAERPAAGEHITQTGARQLAIAFEKARQGLAPLDILTMTARNLGMAPYATKGQRVIYSPVQHEVTERGVLPGDTVEVSEPGWRFKGDIVMRAKVIRSQAATNTPGPDPTIPQ